MNAKSILFSGAMIRAKRAGLKTQTRRILKPQLPEAPEGYYFDAYNGGPLWCWWTPDNRVANSLPMWTCPYGKKGDLLWVRETWRTAASFDALSPTQVGAKAVEAGYRRPWAPVKYEADGFERDYREGAFGPWGKARVSIHMPTWGSRSTAEITDVRVQRLHDMSEGDAAAEGVDLWVAESLGNGCPVDRVVTEATHGSQVQAFAHLWDTINGTDAFNANPWVVALTFKTHHCNVDELLKQRAGVLACA